MATKTQTTKRKTAADKAKKTTKKSTSTKRKTVPSIEFTLMAPDAEEVYLVGDFNDWDGQKYRMRKFKNGLCKKSVKLKPGRYEYCFVVDGHWWTDPQNDNRCANPYGSENSVIWIAE